MVNPVGCISCAINNSCLCSFYVFVICVTIVLALRSVGVGIVASAWLNLEQSALCHSLHGDQTYTSGSNNCDMKIPATPSVWAGRCPLKYRTMAHHMPTSMRCCHRECTTLLKSSPSLFSGRVSINECLFQDVDRSGVQIVAGVFFVELLQGPIIAIIGQLRCRLHCRAS